MLGAHCNYFEILIIFKLIFSLNIRNKYNWTTNKDCLTYLIKIKLILHLTKLFQIITQPTIFLIYIFSKSSNKFFWIFLPSKNFTSLLKTMEILKVNYFFYFSNEYLECKLYNNLVVLVYPRILSHHGQNHWAKAQTKMQVIIQLKLLYV